MGTTWLKILFYTSYAITVIADVTVLFAVWPAYKRTRHRAFLYIAAALVLGIFDTVCDHTLGQSDMSPAQYIPYRTIRRFAYFADIILWATGLILLTRSYLAAIGKESDATSNV
jgi:protein-S-isoprenylcysteine O-methyltransferase Ste14